MLRMRAARTLPLVALILALAWQVSRCADPEPPASPSPHESKNPGEPDLASCDGWPLALAEATQGSGRFASNGWKALAMGYPFLAVDAFEAEGGSDPETRAGLQRAWTEVALALTRARETALASMTRYLEARVVQNPSSPDPQGVFEMLSAATTLQAGRPAPAIFRETSQTASAAMARATTHLNSLRSKAGETTTPGQAAVRWTRHAKDYARALEGLRCPPGAAAHNAAVLAGWGAETLPPPASWLTQLDLETPDFSPGLQPCTPMVDPPPGLYDPNLYTVLSVLASERALSLRTAHPMSGYHAVLTLREIDPARARSEACELEARLEAADGLDAIPYLVFSDLLSVDDARREMQRICNGKALSCPSGSTAVRSQLRRASTWSDRCAEIVRAQNKDIGALVKQFHLYGGPARSRIMSPMLELECPEASHSFAFWQGQAPAGTRWQSVELSLARARQDMERRSCQDAVDQLSWLSSDIPVLRPLYHATKHASAWCVYHGSNGAGSSPNKQRGE